MYIFRGDWFLGLVATIFVHKFYDRLMSTELLFWKKFMGLLLSQNLAIKHKSSSENLWNIMLSKAQSINLMNMYDGSFLFIIQVLIPSQQLKTAQHALWESRFRCLTLRQIRLTCLETMRSMSLNSLCVYAYVSSVEVRTLSDLFSVMPILKIMYSLFPRNQN